MTYTRTSTYAVVSRHWLEPLARLHAWWLNKHDDRWCSRKYGNYEMRYDGRGRRHYLVVDWGGQ